MFLYVNGKEKNKYFKYKDGSLVCYQKIVWLYFRFFERWDFEYFKIKLSLPVIRKCDVLMVEIIISYDNKERNGISHY